MCSGEGIKGQQTPHEIFLCDTRIRAASNQVRSTPWRRARKRAVAYFRPLSHLRYAVARPLWRDGSPSPWRASSGLPGRGCGVIKAWLPLQRVEFCGRATVRSSLHPCPVPVLRTLCLLPRTPIAGARMGPRVLSTDGSGCTQNARLVTRWYRYPAHSLAPIARLFVVIVLWMFSGILTTNKRKLKPPRQALCFDSASLPPFLYRCLDWIWFFSFFLILCQSIFCNRPLVQEVLLVLPLLWWLRCDASFSFPLTVLNRDPPLRDKTTKQ